MESQIQQALTILKRKRDEILNSAMQIGKGYISIPEQDQPQDQAFLFGQSMGMLPPQTGVGGLDDIIKASLVIGQSKPLQGISKMVSKSIPAFDDLDTAIDIIRGKSGGIEDYQSSMGTIMKEARRQLKEADVIKTMKEQGIEGLIDKIQKLVKREEEGKEIVKKVIKPPQVKGGVEGGVGEKLSQAKINKTVDEFIQSRYKQFGSKQAYFKSKQYWQDAPIWKQHSAYKPSNLPVPPTLGAYADVLESQRKVSPQIKGGVPKELEPLAQEARKYKSAEEFINAAKSKQLFRDLSFKQIEQGPRANLTFGGEGVIGQKMTLSQEKANKVATEQIMALKNQIKQRGNYQGLERELTDFYTQATKGIPQVKGGAGGKK